MENQMPVRIALVLLAAAFLASSTMMCVSARYLPTRSQEDRLEKLRELLKDLFNSDYDQNRAYQVPADIQLFPERAAIFKRSVGQQFPAGRDETVKAVVSRNGVSPPGVTSSGGNGYVQLPVLENSFVDSERKGME